MDILASGAAERQRSRRPDASDQPPAPTTGMLKLLGMLRRPLPLSELRPAASAAGLTVEQIETAISLATRRGELRVVADRDGLVLALWRRT